MSLGGFVVLRFGFVESLSGHNISSLDFTQWSRQVKDGSLSVSELCSPSKVRANQCHSPRERYFVTPFPEQQCQKMLVLRSAPDC
jgi:hypothetical protein